MNRLVAPLGLAILFAVASAAAAAPYHAPKTVDGAPDLQGVWTNGAATRLQRPKAFKALVATPYEAAAYEKTRADRFAKGAAPTPPDAPPLSAGEVEDESPQWTGRPPGLARIHGEIRSSWIVEPQDGRVPFTDDSRATSEKATKDEEIFNDPETRPFDERCMLGGGGGVAAPIVNRDLMQIVQTRDRLVILGEDNHEARVVRIGDKHLPGAIQPWMGDSIGWWDGQTLVVETINFSPSEHWRWNSGDYIPVSTHTRITERFTRTGPADILYAFAVEDPTLFTRVWKGEIPLHPTHQKMFEFACHEGNYALTNILRGARAQERAKAAAAP